MENKLNGITHKQIVLTQVLLFGAFVVATFIVTYKNKKTLEKIEENTRKANA